MFCPESLLDCVMKSLCLLKRAVKLNNVPYDMLPERNLLTEKVAESERIPLLKQLTELLKADQ